MAGRKGKRGNCTEDVLEKNKEKEKNKVECVCVCVLLKKKYSCSKHGGANLQ